ncbi:MAG: FAD-dependent oxidoreductase [Candidatus Latescibacteria bacterium]|nr:FAD-dependent oxidoreductase [Candidatus Latescibacterota bacterium]NIO27218.1 FAD-dependent oxidoreductase [Candidatus Latescibacterota bacterium]NIO54742.1 FAD-dependent oxidoreductase [Candidatus Latescibacterota bacterium]NIT00825.1 FAD-dependent oxidoreductase [Candidatus Latescibacterota bacterium]NIT37748.1 FAD-dependent oxidoreductase [Candidatus Latescibacterota bacterium]
MNNRIGVFICHCGVNISTTVDVEEVTEFASKQPNVVVARNYKFMCSEPGQAMIQKDIGENHLDAVVVAACSPQMHELTFRNACEEGGINRYLFQMSNIREHCSWIHDKKTAATQKAEALVNAAIRRVAWHEPLEPTFSEVNPATLIVGAGIAGIQAALEIAESGNPVYLVEKESTIGGKMAKFDKTFPTLDCAACILTPKMVSISHRKNIHLMTMAHVEKVDGFIGNFKVTVRKKARYVNEKCTSCNDCVDVCPVKVPHYFDEYHSERTAIHKAFPQAVPNTYVIDKQEKPPCIEACPIRQEAAGYVALIRERRFKEAAELIRLRNPLPVVCGRVCYHPCETECNRDYVEKPIAIQYLKRFALDWAREQGESIEPPKIERRAEKVAVIGSGPAGLTCAHDLAAKGYDVAVFEKLSELGGMLRVGIPAYRLPRHLLKEELDYLKKLGITFKMNAEFGKKITINRLKEEGYQAIFLAAGAHAGVTLDILGEGSEGVISGVDYLRRVNLGIESHTGRNVAVIGGGNTAMDAARTALREGAEKVTILYRRTRAEMPAAPHEVDDAEEEGIRIHYLIAPTAIARGPDGKLDVTCINIELGEPDASGRRRPIPIKGSEHVLEFDMVIPAISQNPDPKLFSNGGDQLKKSRWGTIEVDEESLKTNIDGVFSGGDVVLGPSTVIASMGAGRRAAESIDKCINGQPLENFQTHMPKERIARGEDFRPHSYAPMFKDIPKSDRVGMRKLPAHARVKGYDEVELGFSEEEAVREASRCLNCGVCVECLACVKTCQPEAIDHRMQNELVDIEVGQILLATGYDLFDASHAAQFGYGKLDNVLSSLEFERMLSSTGPTGGKLLCKNGKEPRAIGIIHCIGSRDENYHKYCSRVCCMYALKFAHLVKDRTDAEVYQFYIDMRAYGKGFEEFYNRVLMEAATVIRGKVAEVVPSGPTLKEQGHLVIRCEDTLVSKFREIPVDMVVLCNAIEPTADSEDIRRLFSISRSPDGFYLERHPKLDPTATMTDGIYIAGCCQGPKDIPDTVSQAAGAAARMLAIIAKGKVELDPIRAEIQEELCSGCRICNSLCPYFAIDFDAEKKISIINTALCKGCGTCVAACPAAAITGKGFTNNQIFAEIEGMLV